MKLSILICTYNRRDLLRQTIESLHALELPDALDAELIVITNACTDDSVEVATRACEGIGFPARVVVEAKPGLNHARNRGLQEGTGDFLAFLDDDVLVDPGWARGMIHAFEHRGGDVVGGRVELWWEVEPVPEWFGPRFVSLLAGTTFDRDTTTVGPSDILGANFALRRRVADAIAGFRPDLDRKGSSLISGGETEYLERARAAGFRLIAGHDAAVRHWVPRERATSAYIRRLGLAKGRSQVRMRRPFAMAKFLRILLGYSYLTLKSAGGEVVALCRGQPYQRMSHYVRRMVGVGGLMELFDRGGAGA